MHRTTLSISAENTIGGLDAIIPILKDSALGDLVLISNSIKEQVERVGLKPVRRSPDHRDSSSMTKAFYEAAHDLAALKLSSSCVTWQEHPEMVGAISAQVGALLERESETLLREEFAVRARELQIAQLQKEVEKERDEKVRIRAELEKVNKTNKYLKTQRIKTKRKG
jgi:hypothetical protein